MMMHALAIGRAGPDATAAINGLWNAGYQSIMRVEVADEIPAVLANFHPDLIVALPDAVGSASLADLRRMAKKADAPIVVARSDVERALACLGPSIAHEEIPSPLPRRTLRLQLAA